MSNEEIEKKMMKSDVDPHYLFKLMTQVIRMEEPYMKKS